MQDTTQPVSSPCIRNCCLDLDDICLGCFRSLEEIMQWGTVDNQTRNRILLNSEQRRLKRIDTDNKPIE